MVDEDSLLSLLRISAAFAMLTFSTSDGVTVEVKQGHVCLAREFVEEVLEMLDVEDYKITHGELALAEEDRREYSALLARSEVAPTIVEALSRGPSDSHDLAEDTGHEASHLRRLCAELKAMGFLERVAAGYRLTKEGVQLWREFHVPKVVERTQPSEAAAKGSSSPFRDTPRSRTSVAGKPIVRLLTGDEDQSYVGVG